MVLTFGGSKLFGSNEQDSEVGVFNQRGEEIPEAESIPFGESNIGSSFEDITNGELIINVRDGRKIFIIATAEADTEHNEFVEMRIQRDGITISANSSVDWGLSGATGFIIAPIVVQKIDDPGEGIHTYKVQGRSSGVGDISRGQLSAMTLRVTT